MRGVSGDDPAGGAGVASRQSADREVGGRRLGSIRAPAARPSRRFRQQCRKRDAGLSRPKTVTAERREASAPIARCAPRLNQRGNYKDYAPVGAPPSPRGWQQEMKDHRGAASAAGRRELRFERNCSSKSKEWVPGTSGTGLFDIVNGMRCASPRAQPGGWNATRSGEAPRIAGEGIRPSFYLHQKLAQMSFGSNL